MLFTHRIPTVCHSQTKYPLQASTEALSLLAHDFHINHAEKELAQLFEKVIISLKVVLSGE